MFTSKTLSFIFPLITTIIILLTIPYNVVLAHNITEILDSEPTLSEFNNYLTQTKLDEQINSRSTITVLALTNSVMSSFTSNLSISAIKNILSLHVLLDYYGDIKLHDIANNTSVTTLYQSSGVAEDQIGRLNIIQRKGKEVEFVSAQPGSGPGPKYVKEIRTIPYNISILEISSPIIVPTLLTSGLPDNSTANITDALLKAGMKSFTSLITSTGVIKGYNSQLTSGNGITIFAPTDVALNAKNMRNVTKLSNAEVVAVLQFHALDSYAPIKTLKSSKGDLKTLAPAGKFGLTVSFVGDVGTLHTGIVDANIASTILDASDEIVIYSVDRVLLPEEIFEGLNITTDISPAKPPVSDSPTVAPVPAKSPKISPPFASPPAPPTTVTPTKPPEVDDGGDNGGDEGGSPDNSEDGDAKNGGLRRNVSLLVVVVVMVISILI